MRKCFGKLFIAICASSMFVAMPGSAGETPASDVEIVQLPKFCWGHLGSDVAKGPEFRIPKGKCGPGTNHYCPGLLNLLRAKQVTNKRHRLRDLGIAETRVRYTRDWIKKHPKCPIHGHVEATLAEIAVLKASAGAKK